MKLIHWAILIALILICMFVLPIDRRQPTVETLPCETDTQCHEMYPERCAPEESYCF